VCFDLVRDSLEQDWDQYGIIELEQFHK
jgi:hypothetical protein